MLELAGKLIPFKVRRDEVSLKVNDCTWPSV